MHGGNYCCTRLVAPLPTRQHISAIFISYRFNSERAFNLFFLVVVVVQFSPFPTGTDVNPGFLQDKAPLPLQRVTPCIQTFSYLLHSDLQPNSPQPGSTFLPQVWLSLPKGEARGW